tara:strand:- start:563 stop:970 length:408 start_codon:yes stop_codon:yes gene_type:complete
MVDFNLDSFTKQVIGFDNLFDFATTLQNKDIGYPPYDLIKGKDDHYILNFALAGFTKDNLNVEVKEKTLTISGSNDKDVDIEYMHKGIASRSFERKFVLADTLHVEDVTFNDGILQILIKQIIPEEQKPKQLKIK